MLKGIIVCSVHPGDVPAWLPPVQTVQKTVSHVSQNSNSWFIWIEHFGMTSRRWRDIRSSNWLTRKLGGNAETPPRGIVMSSRQMGHRNAPDSRVCDAAILVKQWRQTCF